MRSGFIQEWVINNKKLLCYCNIIIIYIRYYKRGGGCQNQNSEITKDDKNKVFTSVVLGKNVLLPFNT